MKKKIALICVFVFVCLTGLTACSYRFYEQDLTVFSWQYADADNSQHNFGKYFVHIPYGKKSQKLAFYVKNKDKDKFLKDLTAKNNVWKKETDVHGNDAYVFLQDGNYYLLLRNSRKKDYAGFYFVAAYSVFWDKEQKEYVFPLYEFSALTARDKNNLDSASFDFYHDEPTMQTQKDWQFFVDFYSNIDQKYCKVDKENKTILTKALRKQDVATSVLSDEYTLKITYKETGGTRTLTVEKI